MESIANDWNNWLSINLDLREIYFLVFDRQGRARLKLAAMKLILGFYFPGQMLGLLRFNSLYFPATF